MKKKVTIELGFRAMVTGQLLVGTGMALLLCISSQAARSTSSTTPTSPIGMLKVPDAGVSIPLKDLGLSYPVGKRLPLFQETRDYYVVKVSTPEYGERLCAFPVRNRRGEGTAWVTEDGLLIFGRQTESCPGRFYFSRGELLPVVAKGKRGYLVEVRRLGHKVEVLVPQDREGFEFVQWTPPSQKKEAQELGLVVAQAAPEKKGTQPRPKPAEPSMRRVERVARPHPGPGEGAPAVIRRAAGAPETKPGKVTQPSATQGITEVVSAAIEERKTARLPTTEVERKAPLQPEAKEYIIEIEIPEELRPPTEGPEEERAGSEKVLPSGRPGPAEMPVITAKVVASAGAASAGIAGPTGPMVSALVSPDHVETIPPQAVPSKSSQPVQRPAGFTIFFGLGAVALQIVLVVVVIEAVLIVRLKRQLAGGTGAAASERVDFVTVGETTPADFYFQIAEEEGDFSGLLVSFSLAELVQFLHNAEDNGVLMLKREDGSIVGQFFFKNGEVIDAFFEEERGTDAFRRAFAEGGNLTSFAFRRKNLSGKRRYIKEQTLNLLMEVVKAADHGELQGGGAPPDLDALNRE